MSNRNASMQLSMQLSMQYYQRMCQAKQGFLIKEASYRLGLSTLISYQSNESFLAQFYLIN